VPSILLAFQVKVAQWAGGFKRRWLDLGLVNFGEAWDDKEYGMEKSQLNIWQQSSSNYVPTRSNYTFLLSSMPADP
jgi:hypothetical protein